MSALTKAGDFSLPVTTGNYSITGIGFQPKFILFVSMGYTGGGTEINVEKSFGCAISSTDQRSMNWTSESILGTSNARRGWSSTKCLYCYQYNSTTVLDYAANLVSMDSDGFTINVTTAPPSGRRVEYICFGGTDFTNAVSGRFDLSSASTPHVETGIGFEPDFLLMFSTAGTTNSDFSSGDITCGIGFTSGNSKQASYAFSENTGQATSDVNSYQRTDSALVLLTDTGAEDMRLSLTSFDSGGFTLAKTVAPATTRRIHYLAVKGGEWFVDKFLSKTSTGSLAVTGIGFQPKALFLSSIMNPASTVPVSNALISMGMATGSTNRAANGMKIEDNVATTDAFMFHYNDNVYNNWNPTGTVRDGYADFTSFDSDGFTLNQVDADPVANQIIYFVVGDTVVAALEIDPNSIASSEAWGSPSLSTGNIDIDPYSIASSEAWGLPIISIEEQIVLIGIGSGEEWGLLQLSKSGEMIVYSIDSSEAWGLLTLSVGNTDVNPNSIASGEAWGLPVLLNGNVDIEPHSIESSESWGNPVVQGDVVYIVLDGIPSEEAWGLLSIGKQLLFLSIPSGETWGLPIVMRGTILIAPNSIESAEAFGLPSLSPGIAYLLPVGIASLEAFGLPIVNPETVYITSNSIASGEAWGLPTIFPGTAFIISNGISSQEAWGNPTFTMGEIDVQPYGISSQEAWGSPYITVSGVQISPYSIESAEAFGSLSINVGSVNLSPSSIGSEESWGLPGVVPGDVTIILNGIPSEESFGTVNLGMHIQVDSIISEEAWGSLSLDVGPVDIIPYGISSQEAWGSSIVRNVLIIELEGFGISSGETFGLPTVYLLVLNSFMQQMEEDLEEGFFNDEEFAEEVVYIHKNGYNFVLTCIFDNESVMVDAGTGAQMMSRDPLLIVKTKDFKYRPEKGDKVNARGTRYQVVDHEPDGTGVSTIQLHHERTV